MRLLIAIAISTLLLISGAFAQSNSPSDTPSERAKSETQVLEKARSEAQRGNSDTKDDRQNAAQTEAVQAEHPDWYSGDAVLRAPQQPSQPAFAVLDRLAPDVLAVYLEQVERAEDRAGIGSVAADEIEHGQAAVVADDGLAVDDAGFDGQLLDRGRHEREAIGEVVAISGH